MNTGTLVDLYAHMQWADAAVWRAVLASENAIADLKLRDYFYHLHVVQRAFLRLWRNESIETPFPTFEDTPSILSWARTYYDDALAYIGTVSDERASQPLPVAWAAMVEQSIGRPPAATMLLDTTLQVPLHSLHHRGQINARLSELGGKPPLVDYIAWVWLGKPPPDWPELAPT